MPQSINFTDDDFEYIREICQVPNKSDLIVDLITRCNALNPAQVTACQRDIEKYKATEYGTEKSKGGIKGTDYDAERNRCQITAKMRQRLGFGKIPCESLLDPFAFASATLRIYNLSSEEDEYSK